MEGVQLEMFKPQSKRCEAVRNAIRHMSPYWITSRRNIMDAYGTPGFVETIQQNYCPYGGSGFYGGDLGKKGVFTLTGWDMRSDGITFLYEPTMVETMTWKEFAENIGELIRDGEYTEEDT